MNTFSKLAFFAFLPFLFLSATAADETYDPFIKTLSGRVKDESKRKGSLHLFFLEVVKDKETKIYTIRGVMAKPQERPYIWKGTGTVKKLNNIPIF